MLTFCETTDLMPTAFSVGSFASIVVMRALTPVVVSVSSAMTCAESVPVNLCHRVLFPQSLLFTGINPSLIVVLRMQLPSRSPESVLFPEAANWRKRLEGT